MPSINVYVNLIKEIPVLKQSAKIKKSVWGKFLNNNYSHSQEIDYEQIGFDIFGTNEIVEISREDIFNESDTKKKIVMILMWGYPTGGRGFNITKILKVLGCLEKTLDEVNNRNLSDIEFNDLIKVFENISGLGFSTWSKLLYFFKVKFKSKSCQIYDSKIVESLNKKQFQELCLQGKTWGQNINDYCRYIDLVHNFATQIRVSPDQVELFLFCILVFSRNLCTDPCTPRRSDASSGRCCLFQEGIFCRSRKRSSPIPRSVCACR